MSFFVKGRTKASADVEFSQSTICYLSRHKHTLELTVVEKKYKGSSFFFVSAFSFAYKVEAEYTEVKGAFMWAIRSERKPEPSVCCVPSAISLECYSCSGESSDSCKLKQQCGGTEDSCLKLTSNGKSAIKQSDIGNVSASSHAEELGGEQTAHRRSPPVPTAG